MSPEPVLVLLQERPVSGDVSLTWPAMVATLAGLSTIFSVIILGLVKLIKMVVKSELAPVNDKLRTNNGVTVGEYAETAAVTGKQLLKAGERNYNLIVETSRRLDEHIVRGHSSERS